MVLDLAKVAGSVFAYRKPKAKLRKAKHSKAISSSSFSPLVQSIHLQRRLYLNSVPVS